MGRLRMNETLAGELLINMGEHCSKRRVVVKLTSIYFVVIIRSTVKVFLCLTNKL